MKDLQRKDKLEFESVEGQYLIKKRRTFEETGRLICLDLDTNTIYCRDPVPEIRTTERQVLPNFVKLLRFSSYCEFLLP